MSIRPFIFLIPAVLAVTLVGCERPITADNFDNWMPGKPKLENAWKPAQDITDFDKLFAQNCRGCHGDGKTVGAAIDLSDPTLLAILTPDELKTLITNGVPKTAMPAFSVPNGGNLTDAQIQILVDGIQGWKNVETAPKGPLPAYSAPLGDATRGAEIYKTYSASILEKTPAIGKDGFLTNPAFLGMVTDQYLRLLVIAGRPELGIPSYQTAISGQPMSDQDIADVVAWLATQRQNEFGQPVGVTPSSNL